MSGELSFWYSSGRCSLGFSTLLSSGGGGGERECPSNRPHKPLSTTFHSSNYINTQLQQVYTRVTPHPTSHQVLQGLGILRLVRFWEYVPAIPTGCPFGPCKTKIFEIPNYTTKNNNSVESKLAKLNIRDMYAFNPHDMGVP